MKKRMRTIVDSRGRAALAQWFAADEDRRQSILASWLEVTQPLVAAWLMGAARPSARLREALERVCGIPTDAWLTDKERAAVERAASLPPTAA